MYRKFVSAMYVLNILFQSLFNLATPILVMLGISWLLVSKGGAPEWIYAVLPVFGALVGFVSMIKFILSAMSSLEKLENQHRESDRKKAEKDRENKT